jgi:glycosyltransferase involved in cell wall biosynthesis
LPQISVIIPVFNAQRYLSECLDSVINQTFKDTEIICVNDGSSDNSLEILKSYAKKDKRIKIIDKTNTGSGDSRNTGLKACCGKYIIFLDADDFVEENMFKELYNKIEETNSDIAFCDYYRYHNETGKIELKKVKTKLINSPTVNFYTLKEKIFLTTPAPWTKIYRRSFTEKNHLSFQNTKSCNDVAFYFLSFILAKSISYVPQPLVYYRFDNPYNISKQRGEISHYQCILQVYTYIKQELIKRGIFPKFKKLYQKKMLEAFYSESLNMSKPLRKTFTAEAKKQLSFSQYLKFLYKRYPLHKFIFSLSNNKNKKEKHLTTLGLNFKIKRK